MRRMVDSAPTVGVSISNYHYEDVEIRDEPSNKPGSELEKKQKDLKRKRDEID